MPAPSPRNDQHLISASERIFSAQSDCRDICPASPYIFGVTNALRMTKGQSVYVMSTTGGHYKVGIAKNPYQRQRELQTGCPLPITIEGVTAISDHGVDAARMEAKMHELLADFRGSGEWFNAPPEVIGRAWKEAWVRLACPSLYQRWQRFRLHMSVRKRRAEKAT